MRAGGRFVGGLAAAATAAAGMLVLGAPASAGADPSATTRAERSPLRVATYNVSLNRPAPGGLVADLAGGDDAQARAIAQVLQTTRPDVVLLNEFDFDAGSEAVDLFREQYLQVSQHGESPIRYPYAFVAPVNTGVGSGHDLNNDGEVGGPDDALGFGQFPGQYGMVVLSRHPIDTDNVRTFQNFRWQDMPGALLPDDPGTDEPADWYGPEELDDLPLSSKSHWDVPVETRRGTVHVLASHPTPPTFDGPEDRNGQRNHDEIRFWADYVGSRRDSAYIYDDAGDEGGLRPGSRFVILGDQNADPLDGDSVPGAIDQLVDHPRVRDPRPTSEGAVEAAAVQGGSNAHHEGDAALDTADFTDDAPGNLRVDYALPSKNLPVQGAGVFWPMADQAGSELTGVYPFPTSDHRLVWVDLRMPGGR
ncbi:endonuclease/exonuclease/phosphatase family protein [Georgenia sp. SUBG003]|uniref:endonuclease/exonuclease/phosphatase family protein n=1 Tax=Georgenia sp. SUBG003 TaxID=1497974 RepID=UPI0005B92BBF